MSTAITKVNTFKVELMKEKKISTFMWWDEEKINHFRACVTRIVENSPKLLESPQEVMSAVIDLASIGLMPDQRGLAYILPFKWKPTAMIWYKWWIEIMHRAWIKWIATEVVRDKDIFTPKIEDWIISHEIDYRLSTEERWEPYAVWAKAILPNGWSICKIMWIKELIEYRDKYVPSYKNPKKNSYWKFSYESTPWHTDEEAMYKKVLIYQLSKLLPKTLNWNLLDRVYEIENKSADVEVKTTTWIDPEKLAESQMKAKELID